MSLEDVQAIQRLKYACCFAIGEGRYEEWVALFTEDETFVRDNGERYDGHEELLGFATEGFDSAFEHAAHVVTNPLVDVDGNSATGKRYLLLFYRSASGSVGVTQATYDDSYRRVNGAWRIEQSTVSSGLTPQF